MVAGTMPDVVVALLTPFDDREVWVELEPNY
jgi:hypothetical protein